MPVRLAKRQGGSARIVPNGPGKWARRSSAAATASLRRETAGHAAFDFLSVRAMRPVHEENSEKGYQGRFRKTQNTSTTAKSVQIQKAGIKIAGARRPAST